MLVDTHAHINLHAFKNDADEVMHRSLSAGMVVINVGTDVETSWEAVNMLERYPKNVYAVVGLHPSHTYDNPYLDENESMSAVPMEHFNTTSYYSMAKNERVVGVGECGLDYYRLPEEESRIKNQESSKELQKDAFLEQIKLARELDKALVIHCRPSKGSDDAYEDVLQIISNSQFLISNEDKKPGRFEVHSFTGSLEVAQKFLELGGYIGLNGIITFGDRKNKNMPTSAEALLARRSLGEAGAKAGDKTGNMEQVVKGVPLERIVLETDSPYLAPAPNRGKRNEPINVQAVAQKIAEIKGISFEEVSRQTTENALKLFNIAL